MLYLLLNNCKQALLLIMTDLVYAKAIMMCMWCMPTSSKRQPSNMKHCATNCRGGSFYPHVRCNCAHRGPPVFSASDSQEPEKQCLSVLSVHTMFISWFHRKIAYKVMQYYTVSACRAKCSKSTPAISRFAPWLLLVFAMTWNKDQVAKLTVY